MKYLHPLFINGAAAVLLSITSSHSFALDVKITQDLDSVPVHHGDEVITIQRVQDQNNVLSGGFTKTSRKCPPFCVQPLHVAPGVTTVGELELLDFIKQKLEAGKGLLVDARTPSWFQKGSIPGSVNIPFTHFDPKNSTDELSDILVKLKVKKKGDSGGSLLDGIKNLFNDGDSAASGQWDFSSAQDILLYCNGMWCGQSPKAIKNLLSLGYPPEKIFYYRGGMQSWQLLGLTIYVPK